MVFIRYPVWVVYAIVAKVWLFFIAVYRSQQNAQCWPWETQKIEDKLHKKMDEEFEKWASGLRESIDKLDLTPLNEHGEEKPSRPDLFAVKDDGKVH